MDVIGFFIFLEGFIGLPFLVILAADFSWHYRKTYDSAILHEADEKIEDENLKEIIYEESSYKDNAIFYRITCKKVYMGAYEIYIEEKHGFYDKLVKPLSFTMKGGWSDEYKVGQIIGLIKFYISSRNNNDNYMLRNVNEILSYIPQMKCD